MNFSKERLSSLYSLKKSLRESSPLIHCITNPISINDCANAVLAIGAKPIMAEHPKEAEEITAASKALAVNLGNITDARLESIMLSGKKAKETGLKSVIDIVGAGCSSLRLNFARDFIKNCSPSVIKGNISELKALYGEKSDALGIDAGKADAVTESNLSYIASFLSELSIKYNCIIAATGAVDIAAYNYDIYIVSNGCEKMSIVTGTGCIVNVITGALLSVASTPLDAVLFALSYFGVCGELSDKGSHMGTGSFHTSLTDNLYLCSEKSYTSLGSIKKQSLKTL